MRTTRFQSRGTAEADVGTPKLHVVTFGCQMNKYDSMLAEGRFQARGYSTTSSMRDADVVLFNTCSVRENPESWFRVLRCSVVLLFRVLRCSVALLAKGTE